MDPLYGLGDYDAMAADVVRSAAYASAIARVVGPGDVVVEVGTGLGYFAVLACRAGARRVYALESNPLGAIAAEIAAENGVADRVSVIVADSRGVDLPERADVLLSDLRGLLPFNGDATEVVADAYRRFCRPGARVVARRDVVRAAPCAVPEPIRSAPSLDLTLPGLRRTAVERRFLQQWWKAKASAGDLLSDAEPFAEIRYGADAITHCERTMTWTVCRDGALGGLLVWFDAHLAEGVGFSTGPSSAPTVYGQAFFPLGQAVRVCVGDTVRARMAHHVVGGGSVWAWETTVERDGVGMARDARNTLGALLTPRALLDRHRDDYVPASDARLAEVRELLDLVDGARPLAAMADTLRMRHPGRFDTRAAALTFVADTLATIGDV